MPEKAVFDRMAVEKKMAAGFSRADAVAEFDTDENFAQWYEGFCRDLSAAVAE